MALPNNKNCTEDDDFEYHLTFPSPTPQSLFDGERDDFVYVEKEVREPVILLLGWAGCRDQNLSRYSALYQVKGCITIRYVPSAKDLFYDPRKFQQVAVKLLEMLSDLSLEEHPVFFHMFSNDGCMLYYYISEFVCKAPGSQVRVRGCIFDSGPAMSTIVGMTRAVLASVQGGKMHRMFVGVMAFFYFTFVGLMDSIIGFFWKQRQVFESGLRNLWKTLAEESMRCPQLFLFSKADAVCNYKSIQQFLEYRRNKGVLVRSICWDDSPHVDHLSFHTDVYIETVYNFLNECLRTDTEILPTEC